MGDSNESIYNNIAVILCDVGRNTLGEPLTISVILLRAGGTQSPHFNTYGDIRTPALNSPICPAVNCTSDGDGSNAANVDRKLSTVWHRLQDSNSSEIVETLNVLLHTIWGLVTFDSHGSSQSQCIRPCGEYTSPTMTQYNTDILVVTQTESPGISVAQALSDMAAEGPWHFLALTGSVYCVCFTVNVYSKQLTMNTI